MAWFRAWTFDEQRVREALLGRGADVRKQRVALLAQDRQRLQGLFRTQVVKQGDEIYEIPRRVSFYNQI